MGTAPTTPTLSPSAGFCPPEGQQGSHPPSTCDARPAEPGQNRAIKTGRRWWWDEAVFGMNLSSLSQLFLGFRVNQKQHRAIPGMAGRKVCRRTLAKTSTAERSRKWQDASGNTDGYAEPKQTLTLSTLGGFGMPEREGRANTCHSRGMPLSHLRLIWGLQRSRGKKIKCTLHQAGLENYLRKFFTFSLQKRGQNGVFFANSHLGF